MNDSDSRSVTVARFDDKTCFIGDTIIYLCGRSCMGLCVHRSPAGDECRTVYAFTAELTGLILSSDDTNSRAMIAGG